MLIEIILTCFCFSIANAIIYDSYTGKQANESEIARLTAAKILLACTNDIEPCNESDWRRVDGSCNNLEYITAGAYNTPQIRLLEPVYTIVNGSYEVRPTKSGKPWPLPRDLRNLLLLVGAGIDGYMAQSASYYTEFMFGDVGSIHDIRNYVIDTPYCCEEKGKTDYMCIPNKITDDDPVHRFDSLRCLNLTRPLSFQNVGCIAKNSVPARVNNATIFFDLSSIYAYSTGVISKIRTFESGLLKTETVDGRIFPSDANENTTCFIQDAIETGCTRDVPNTLLGTDLFTCWFWRWHNLIATLLAELNPCWNDDQLFYNARDINIAIYQQIYYYEFLPLLFGRDTLIEKNIISADNGLRETYNSSIVPRLALEYPYAYRWFHTVQDMRQKMYDKDDKFVKVYPVGNFTLRVQDLAKDNNMAMITHGVYIQPTGLFDHAIHPDMADVGLGPVQTIFDIPTADLTKGRYFGFQPYLNYLNFCSYNKTYTCFDDLLDIMDEDRVDLLKASYEDIEDVELLAGMWSEKIKKGTHVPPTVGCLLMDQLKRSLETDRHWFERPNRPHAFTEDTSIDIFFANDYMKVFDDMFGRYMDPSAEHDNQNTHYVKLDPNNSLMNIPLRAIAAQLLSVRNATLARLFCDVGDDVTKVQAHAFLRISYENPMVSCDDIPSIDLSPWKDDSCDSCDE